MDAKQSVPWCQDLIQPNYCEHDRFSPALFVPPETHKKRSLAVVEAIKRLADAYFNPWKLLPELQVHADTGNQAKSQRRSAAIIVLQAMLHYVDYESGRVGLRLENGKWNDLSLEKLAQATGLKLGRVKRAVQAIMRAGYIRVTGQFSRKANGDIFNLPSIREFLPSFFTSLDIKGELWQKWFRLKQWARERLEKKEKKKEKKESRQGMAMLADAIGTIAGRGRQKQSTQGAATASAPRPKSLASSLVKKPPKAKSRQQIEADRQQIGRALEMHKSDPSRTVTDYLKMLGGLSPG